MMNRWKTASTLKKFGMIGAFTTVVGAAALSAMFVDYLADRARERAATFTPAVAGTVKTASVAAEQKPRKHLPRTVMATAAAKAVKAEAKAGGGVASEVEPGLSSSKISEDESLAGTVQAGDELPGVNAYAASDDTSGGDDPFTSAIDDGAAPIPSEKPPVPPRAEKKVASLADDGATDDSAGGKPARVGRSVTMRAAPKKGAAAIGNIPGNSPITLFGCKSWCEVSFKGKRGFIYKSFLGRS